MNGNCCNLWREEIKGDIRMESGLFIFHISNCLLCLFVCYIKVPGFSWRPTFRCLSLERGGGQEAEEVYMEPKLWCSSLRNLVNTSYIHIKQTQHSFNLHIIHLPSAIHKMYSRWSKGREVDICVQAAGTSSCVCCIAVSRRWRCS